MSCGCNSCFLLCSVRSCRLGRSHLCSWLPPNQVRLLIDKFRVDDDHAQYQWNDGSDVVRGKGEPENAPSPGNKLLGTKRGWSDCLHVRLSQWVEALYNTGVIDGHQRNRAGTTTLWSG